MTVVLLAGLEIGQVLLAFLRFAPDAPVEDAHDGDGRVESGDGRPERNVIVGLDKLDEALVCFRINQWGKQDRHPLIHRQLNRKTCSSYYIY